VLLWICWRYFPRIYRGLHAWREQREHSEPAYFRNLQHACRRNDAMQSYECFLKWLMVAYPNTTVHDFLSSASDPALSSETNHLGTFLFVESNHPAPWNGSRMGHLLKQHRKQKNRYTASGKYLLKLNP
jgi:hypothetical protein